MEYRDEQVIAKKAEQMLTSALQRKTKSSFKDHYNGNSGKASIKEAFAKSVVKRYGKKKDGNQQIFMRRLVIRMARHGFVQHYGVNTTRAGAERVRTKPKSTSYFYEAHKFNMKATPFISEVIQQSKVVDFVVDNITELRAKNFAEELVFPLSHFAREQK